MTGDEKRYRKDIEIIFLPSSIAESRN